MLRFMGCLFIAVTTPPLVQRLGTVSNEDALKGGTVAHLRIDWTVATS